MSICFQQVVFRRTIQPSLWPIPKDVWGKKVTQTQTNSFPFPSGPLNQQRSKVKVRTAKRTEFIKQLFESNGSRQTVCWSNHGWKSGELSWISCLQLHDGFFTAMWGWTNTPDSINPAAADYCWIRCVSSRLEQIMLLRDPGGQELRTTGTDTRRLILYMTPMYSKTEVLCLNQEKTTFPLQTLSESNHLKSFLCFSGLLTAHIMTLFNLLFISEHLVHEMVHISFIEVSMYIGNLTVFLRVYVFDLPNF